MFQDIFYDAGKKCGKIFECIKHRQRRGRELKKAAANDGDITAADIENSVLNVEFEELNEFFSGCVLPADLKKMEKKMTETVRTRIEMLQSSGTQIPKIFDFYWIDPYFVITEINFPPFVNIYYWVY